VRRVGAVTDQVAWVVSAHCSLPSYRDNGGVAGPGGKDRLASQRWADCIQLFIRFVSPIFCIFHRLCSCLGTARNLPGWSANGWKVFCPHGV